MDTEELIPLLLIALCATWAVILLAGGIYARRSILSGLITAVLAAPCVVVALAMFGLGLVVVQAGLFWLGWEAMDSVSARITCVVLANLLGLWAWCWWVRGTRQTPGVQWGAGMTPLETRRPRVNVFMKRPW